MPLFSCVIKRGKQKKKIIVSANTEQRVSQLLRDYLSDHKTSLEITRFQ